MMKTIQVISFLNQNKLMIENYQPIFYVSSIKTHLEIEQLYFQVTEDYLVEYLLIPHYNIEHLKLPTHVAPQQQIVFIQNLSNELQQKLYQVLKNENALILVGSNDSTLKLFSSIVELIPLKNQKILDLSLLIQLFNHQEIVNQLNLTKQKVIALMGKSDKEHLIAQIVLETLKELSLIPKSPVLKLYLFTQEELNVQDMAHIEDPLYEYLQYKSFQIKQYLTNDAVNLINYLLFIYPSSN